MQVIVNRLAAHYRRIGAGKTVLVLHGWGDASKNWQQLAQGLSDMFEVITLDLPGFGDTASPPEPWGLNEYATFVAAFLKKLELKPYAIIGHSNGGAIALRGLGNGVLKTDRLLLLASAGIRGEYDGRNKALRIVTKTGKLLASPLPQSVKKKLRRKVYDAIGSDMLVAEHLQETFKRVVTDDVRADAAQLTVSTLLIYGALDKAAPVRYGQQFQELIKGSRLEVLPETDHFVHLEQPAQVLSLIKEFLA